MRILFIKCLSYQVGRWIILLLTLVCIVVLIYSCSDGVKRKIEYEVDIDVKKMDSGIIFSDIIDNNYKLISLETNDSSLIGKISKICIIDSTIYILDSKISKLLFRFNMQGNFLDIVGENSGGPGSYTFPTDFIVDDDNGHIFILDLGVRILEYDNKGYYLRTLTLEDKGFSAFLFEKTQNGYAFISGGKEDNIILTDNQFIKKSSYFPFVNRNLNKLLIHPLQDVYGDNIIYRRFLNDTIYRIDNGNLKPHFLLNFNNSYSSELFSTHITKEKFLKIIKYGNSCILKFFYENSESIAFAFSCNSEFYFAFYSKLSKDLHLSSIKRFVNDISFEIKSSYIVGTSEEYFIFYIHPQYFIEGVESQGNKYSNSVTYLKALELSHKISKTSNPILLIARLKKK